MIRAQVSDTLNIIALKSVSKSKMEKSRSNQSDDYMVQTVRLKTKKGLSSTKAGRL